MIFIIIPFLQELFTPRPVRRQAKLLDADYQDFVGTPTYSC